VKHEQNASASSLLCQTLFGLSSFFTLHAWHLGRGLISNSVASGIDLLAALNPAARMSSLPSNRESFRTSGGKSPYSLERIAASSK
jgi:hypothetical protein